MLYTLIYDPVALDEYEDAIMWYNERNEDAVERLKSEIEQKLDIIRSDPHRYRNTYNPL